MGRKQTVRRMADAYRGLTGVQLGALRWLALCGPEDMPAAPRDQIPFLCFMGCVTPNLGLAPRGARMVAHALRGDLVGADSPVYLEIEAAAFRHAAPRTEAAAAALTASVTY